MSESVFNYTDQSASEMINVLFYYDGNQQYAHPIELSWQGQDWRLGAVQFWYTERHHDGFAHHYTVTDQSDTWTFRLRLETKNLTWTLEAAEPVDVVPLERPAREVDFGWIAFKPEAQYA